MPNKIITAGCSFTRYKWPCWPAFVGWFEQDADIRNVGASGSSNETIMRSVYNAVNKWSDIKKVYIMWSGTNRYEIIHDTVNPELKKDELVTYSQWSDDFRWNNFYGGHYYSDKHEYYVRWFQNERQNDVRILERILFTQMYLEKHNIEYKMMCYRGHILMHDKDKMSNGQRALYEKIDWDRFIFYKQHGGLDDFTIGEHKDQYNKPYDLHPLPLAHYHWVKDVMYKSDILCPENEYEKLKAWKKTSVFHDEDNRE